MYQQENIQYVNVHFSEVDNDESECSFYRYENQYTLRGEHREQFL
jgi:hypothetical protein